jgi:acetoin utilization deacetylase AcuC-like enzyme
MTTLFTYAPAPAHTRAHHPESHRRMLSLLPALERAGILDQVEHLEPVPATVEQLRRAHTPELIEFTRQISLRGGGLLDHGDTYATAETYEAAALAAGACSAMVDRIMTGEATNGFALIRPPGHHAETDRVSGFCIFNNVAVAARQAQAVHGAERVAVVDFDVHHGNGTQDIFYHDRSVQFSSVHLFAPYFYPGIGDIDETGVGEGVGYTVNVPLPPGVGDVGYTRVFNEVIIPAIERFQPDLILASVGFDAHWLDPLAMAGLSLTGYARLTRLLMATAERVCDGRIGFILEGGYHLDVLTNGVTNVFRALLGHSTISDPYGAMPEPEQPVDALLERLKRLHLSK